MTELVLWFGIAVLVVGILFFLRVILWTVWCAGGHVAWRTHYCVPESSIYCDIHDPHARLA